MKEYNVVMKKHTLFSFVFILSLILLGSLDVKHVNAMSGLLPGCTETSNYSTTTGQSCGTYANIQTCAAGDLFNAITGLPCTTSSTTTTSGTTPTFSIGSRGDLVKAFQQFLKDSGYLSGKADGVYGKKTSEAEKKYRKIHPCPASSPAAGVAGYNCGHGKVPVTPISTSPVSINSVSPNSIEFNINAKEGDSPDQTINITGSGFTSTNNEIVFIQGTTAQVIPNQKGKFEANSIEGGVYGQTVYIPHVSSSNGVSISSIVNNSQMSNAVNSYLEACGGGGGAGDGWRCVEVSLISGSYVMYVKNSNGDISNGLPFTVTSAATTTSTVTTPVITSLSTTSGPVGTQLTISGSGFKSQNTQVWLNTGVGSGLLWSGAVASDSSLSITIPSILFFNVDSPGTSGKYPINPGSYSIGIKNATMPAVTGGDITNTSNVMNFTVTAS